MSMISIRNAAARIAGSLRSDDGNAGQRGRLMLAVAAFAAIYVVIAGRLVALAIMPPADIVRYAGPADSVNHARPDILDRAGTVLATDIMVPSVYAEPNRIINVDEAIEMITSVLTDLDTADLRTKLSSDKHFVWVKREITPREKSELHNLGVPGLAFLDENQRFYPAGNTTAHVLGFVNIDNQGIAGFEQHLDKSWLGDLHAAGLAKTTAPDPVSVSVDLRVQHALRDELSMAMEKFKASASAGIVLDVHTGEVVALASLPDFDPRRPTEAFDPDKINRITTGVYEMGSTFKAFTMAMALDTGRITLNSNYDATRAIRVGGSTIDDYRGKHRVLSVPEIFVYSSNIGTAKMALDVGTEAHQAFLEKMGFFDRTITELPESSSPIRPAKWREVTTMTASFGHGISVSPLQMAAAAAALMNGGKLINPTFARRTEEEADAIARQVIHPSTSEQLRYLMRLNVETGTARNAEVPGYRVGGKTGSAEKVVAGRYSNSKLLTSFLGVFPADEPEYVVLIMLDEPQGITETHGYRTSGWNATPTAGRVIERIAPILGVRPKFKPADDGELLSVSY